jgi:hypothetical protein
MTALKLVTTQDTENKMEELARSVEQAKAETQFPTFTGHTIYDANGQPIEGFSAITNDETKKVNAVMSSRYTIYNHDEAFNVIDMAAKNLCPEAKGNVNFYKDGGLMKVEYLLPDSFNVEVAEGDALRTKLVGANSVDGSKCLAFHIDFERQVCTNGMVGFSREFSFTRRHSRFIHEDVNNFNIAAQVETAWNTVVANAQMLQNNTVDFEKGMAFIKEVVDRRLFPKKLENWISEEWRRATVGANQISAENGSNLWTLYNSFTSAISHSRDNKGNELSDQQKELYGRKLNGVILKLAA